MSDNLRQNSATIFCHDWKEFYKLLQNMDGFTYNAQVSEWRNFVSTLGGGCGCNRVARTQHVENTYKGMVHILTSQNKQEILDFYQAKKITLLSDGVEFLSWE